MALTSMAPLLPELIVARENSAKHADSVTPIRQDPARYVPTLKAIGALAAPVLLQRLECGAWIEEDDRFFPGDHGTAIDKAARLAHRLGGTGRFVQRGKVVGYWGSVPVEESHGLR
jgi:hypothetical protein